MAGLFPVCHWATGIQLCNNTVGPVTVDGAMVNHGWAVVLDVTYVIRAKHISATASDKGLIVGA